MTEKKRLLDLLYKYELIDHEAMSRPDYDSDKSMEACVDFLLAGGVIVPPVKMKQTVYSLERGISQVMVGEVYEICIRRAGVVFRATRKGYFSLAFTAENIGKTVFFTKEEAEKALKAGKERDNGNV